MNIQAFPSFPFISSLFFFILFIFLVNDTLEQVDVCE